MEAAWKPRPERSCGLPSPRSFATLRMTRRGCVPGTEPCSSQAATFPDTLSDQTVPEIPGHAGQDWQEGRIIQWSVKYGSGRKCPARPLIESDRRAVRIHRGWIKKTLDLRIGLVDRPRPALCPRSWSRAQEHGGSRSGRPRARQIQQGEGPPKLETSEPWSSRRPVDHPGVLENLGQTGGPHLRSVEDAPDLKPR